LIKGLNFTQEQAKEEITKVLAELAWRANPEMLNMVLQEALEDSGNQRLLRKMEEQAKIGAEMAATPYQGGGVRQPETSQPLAREIVRESMMEAPRGLRSPPGGV
jgi:hypothetical protein